MAGRFFLEQDGIGQEVAQDQFEARPVIVYLVYTLGVHMDADILISIHEREAFQYFGTEMFEADRFHTQLLAFVGGKIQDLADE